MELRKAIEHLDEIIPTIECEDCKNEHLDLKCWLEELKSRREKDILGVFDKFEFTEDGYVVSNGCYLGLKCGEDDWDWYEDYNLCKKNLEPIINMDIIISISEYIWFIQNY